jgi:hypothetical protein
MVRPVWSGGSRSALCRLDPFGSAPEADERRPRYAQQWDPFVNGIADRASNLVLRLMRRGMRSHFWEHLREARVDSALQRDLFAPIVPAMDIALERRDAAATGEIAYPPMRPLRRAARSSEEVAWRVFC